MFIAALLTIAKTWKQRKCPSTDESIKEMWSVHIQECYSVIKRMKFCHLWQPGWTWRALFSKQCQTEKDKYCMIALTCEIQKYNKLVIITEKKKTHRQREQINGY